MYYRKVQETCLKPNKCLLQWKPAGTSRILEIPQISDYILKFHQALLFLKCHHFLWLFLFVQIFFLWKIVLTKKDKHSSAMQSADKTYVPHNRETSLFIRHLRQSYLKSMKIILYWPILLLHNLSSIFCLSQLCLLRS